MNVYSCAVIYYVNYMMLRSESENRNCLWMSVGRWKSGVGENVGGGSEGETSKER